MKNILLTSVLLFLVLSAYSQNENKVSSEQELKKLSNDWMIATMNRDEKTLNKIVVVEFKLGGTNLDIPDLPREVWMKNATENLKIDSINYIKCGLM